MNGPLKRKILTNFLDYYNGNATSGSCYYYAGDSTARVVGYIKGVAVLSSRTTTMRR